jgi:hypothetical protein
VLALPFFAVAATAGRIAPRGLPDGLKSKWLSLLFNGGATTAAPGVPLSQLDWANSVAQAGGRPVLEPNQR